MVDYTNLIEEVAQEGPDLNETVAGGSGTREPPAAGLARLRFISYVEIGEHMDGKKGEEKRKPLAKLQFELSGPKHQPKELDDGRKIPHVITITLNISQNEKAHYSKLFKRMNWEGKAKNYAQLLGNDYLGTVVHNPSKSDPNVVYANLRDDGGYTIKSPFVEDPETGEQKRVPADPALTPIKVFLWNARHDHPQFKEMWDALFIDGKWDDKTDDAGNVIREGKSKNYWQNTIKSALNFEGSSIHTLLTGGDSLNLPEATKPERTEEAKQASEAAKVEVKTPANDERDPLEMVG